MLQLIKMIDYTNIKESYLISSGLYLHTLKGWYTRVQWEPASSECCLGVCHLVITTYLTLKPLYYGEIELGHILYFMLSYQVGMQVPSCQRMCGNWFLLSTRTRQYVTNAIHLCQIHYYQHHAVLSAWVVKIIFFICHNLMLSLKMLLVVI